MLIVGLGNPGETYENTYHNMGYLVIDTLAELLNKRIIRAECSALTAVKDLPDGKLILAKPITYMNLSGVAVKSLLSKYKQSLDDLIVIYDDIDIPRFSVRVRERGSAGTHNGMRNVVENLGSDNFKRIRMGIGRGDGDLKDYVLGKISEQDKKEFAARAQAVAKLLYEYITSGDFDKVMREGNTIK